MRPRHVSGIAATLATLILAGGSAALGQADDASDSTVEPPQAFTARLACGQDDGLNLEGDQTELPEDPDTTASTIPRVVWRFPTLQVSDPRMGGRVYGYLSGTEWSNESWADEMGVYSALWHVINDGGEWIGPYTTLRAPEIGYATNSIRLEGHGGYEGLYAVIQADFRDDCGWDVTGYILERDVPSFPEPEAALRP